MRTKKLTHWGQVKVEYLLYGFGLLLILLFVIIASSTVDRQAVVRHEQMFNEHQAVQTKLAAQMIKAHVDQLITDIQIMAKHSIPDYLMERRTKESIIRLFKQEMELDTDVVALLYLDRPDNVAVEFYAANEAGDIGANLARTWSAENWETTGESIDNPYFPDFYVTSRHQYYGMLNAVYVDDEYRGTLAMVLDLKTLSENFVSPLRSGQYGAGYLMDMHGTVLYDHETEIIGENVFEGLHDKYPVLMELDRRLVSEPSGKSEYEFTVKRGGQVSRKLIAWEAAEVGNQKMVVCLSAPDIEIDDALWDLRLQRTVLGSVIIAALILLAIVLSRRVVRQAVFESNKRYRTYVSNSPEGIFVCDQDGYFLELNAAACRILGFSDEELTDKSLFDLMITGARDQAHTLFKKLSTTGKASGELLTANRAGSQVYIELSAVHIDTDKYLCFIRDITLRKNTDRELRRLATVVRQSAEMILIADNNNNILYVNPSFEKITGYSFSNAVRRKPGTLLNIRETSVVEQIRSTIRQGVSWRGELTLTACSGATLYVEATISPVRNEDGHIVNYVSVGRDITKQKELEQQLRQSQKMEAIGVLAGGIAHDFNNVLFAIMGNAGLALEELPENSEAHQLVSEVLVAGRRASELVSQILSFARRTEERRIHIDVVSITKEAIKLLRPSLPTTIQIRQQFNTDSAYVYADPTQVHQVIMNLCTNAAQELIKSGGEIAIEISERFLDESFAAMHPALSPGDHVILAVKDNGPGIPPEIRDRIFEPFFTTKDTGAGTGMGLAVVHGIITGLNGCVYFESEAGRGSEFTICLPVSTGPDPIPDKAGDMAVLGTERILLIDDEPHIVKVMAKMLATLGYQITCHTSSTEALQAFTMDPSAFDLVITDQTMPGLTGADLVKEIRDTKPGIPIIVLTGFSHTLSEDQAKEMGINAFLRKPLNKIGLASAIRNILDAQ